jgi:hypothetical protein
VDLSLYGRVLWRFRLLVVFGALLAAGLATLSFLRVDLDGGSLKVDYRQSETWASYATVFVTQEGFPLGRSVYDESLPVTPTTGGEDAEPESYVPRYMDPSRFSSYAQLYARLAGSELLRRQMEREKPLAGSVSATAGTDPRNPGIVLPLVEIQAVADGGVAARETARRATRALLRYVEREQNANEIEPSKRVILRVLNEASSPVLVEPRSRTKPVFIFLAVMLAVAAIAFLLENLRPAARPATPVDEMPPKAQSRRSA